MKRVIIYFLCGVLSLQVSVAQELFSLTEPASNMAAHSIGLRVSSTIMPDASIGQNSIHYFPEVMVGVSKRTMLHVESVVSTTGTHTALEGAILYGKYRFYSEDDVHSHFRMAMYAQFAFNNSDIHQPAIDFKGHNTGYEIGWVGTKLVNKIAVSTSLSLLHALDNSSNRVFIYGNSSRNAVGYTLSVGKLLLPKEYVSYQQVNMNGMIEILGQTNLHTGQTFLDLAPIVQFIFNSKIRLDAGYRFAVSNELTRTAPEGWLFRFEYNIFNAF
jgi:hypothetical protein